MTVAERLEQLAQRIVADSISAKDAEQELRALLSAFDHVDGSTPYRDRIAGAISWARVYATQGKASWHGPDRVRQFLLQDVKVAANWAKRLQDAAR